MSEPGFERVNFDARTCDYFRCNVATPTFNRTSEFRECAIYIFENGDAINISSKNIRTGASAEIIMIAYGDYLYFMRTVDHSRIYPNGCDACMYRAPIENCDINPDTFKLEVKF